MARWRLRFGRRSAWIGLAVVAGFVVVGGSAALVGEQIRTSGESYGGGGTSSSAADYGPMAPQPSSRENSGSASDAAGGAPAAAPESAPQLSPDQDPSVQIGGVGRQLVRSAQLTLEVDDPNAVTGRVRTAAAAVQAEIAEEQSGTSGAYLTLRVPADSLDLLVDQVAGFGKVIDRSGQVADATETVVDLDARVRSQQSSVERIRVLLSQAQTIGDIVAIESELASREAELDSLTSRLASLRDQVAMSTLSISIQTPSTPVPVDGPGPAGFTDGLAAGWAGLVAVGTAVAAVFGFVLPLLPVVAIVVGLVWLVRRMVRGRRRPAPAASGTGDGGA